MYSTSELNELFLILNSIKEFKLDNHSGATQQCIAVRDPDLAKQISPSIAIYCADLKCFMCKAPENFTVWCPGID